MFNQEIQLLNVIREWVDTNSDLLTAGATIAIAFFTFTLWRATSKMMKVAQEQSKDMKASIAIAKKSADAAKASADNLPIVERAYVFANVKFGGINGLSNGDVEFLALLYLKNYGRTPAIIKEIAFMGGNYPNYPVKETFGKGHHPIEPFVASGEKFYEDRWIFIITESQWEKIILRNSTIYCFGCIKYITIFGEEHSHGFCWEYSDPDTKFALSPNDELNYNT